MGQFRRSRITECAVIRLKILARPVPVGGISSNLSKGCTREVDGALSYTNSFHDPLHEASFREPLHRLRHRPEQPGLGHGPGVESNR